MTKKQIKILALKSFVRNDIDPKKVKLFVAKMKRKDLRNYIREVKIIDSRNKVTIIVPSLDKFRKSDLSILLKNYRSKKVIYQEDPDLLVGIKIIDNDQILDFSLKNSLENIAETYD